MKNIISKVSTFLYWVSTGLVLLLVGVGSFADLLMVDAIRESFQHIRFPEYIIPFFGIAKLLGSVAIVLPGRLKLKEWAYAGLAFYFIGATYIHIAVGDGMDKISVTSIIFLVVITSYSFSKPLSPQKAS